MTMLKALHLTADHLRALRTAAERAFPNECCGLLVGGGEEVVALAEIVPAANVAAGPAENFEIDPQQQFDVLRRLRGGATRIVGHYHSHPNGAAALSARDIAMAHDPDAVWVVIPVIAGRAGDVQAFVCPAAGPQPVPITIASAQ